MKIGLKLEHYHCKIVINLLDNTHEANGIQPVVRAGRKRLWQTVPAISRSQWPRGLRHRSAAAWFLGSWIRIPLVAWMFFSRVLIVMLSCVGTGLCVGLITRPEESYRVSNCVCVRPQKPRRGP
jgi:hypothetical protein